MNQASHYVDLLDWLIGPVESVQAYTATLARNIEVEDTGVVSVRWRSGALGSHERHDADLPEEPRGLASRSSARRAPCASAASPSTRSSTGSSPSPTPTTSRSSGASYETTSVYGFGHPLYYDNVIKVLRGEAEPETDGREGLRSLEILIADLPVGARRQRVALPLEY